jgi:hypothetical protein
LLSQSRHCHLQQQGNLKLPSAATAWESEWLDLSAQSAPSAPHFLRFLLTPWVPSAPLVRLILRSLWSLPARSAPSVRLPR